MCTTTKSTVFYFASIRRCGGLRIRRLLLAGCFFCGILGCDSISGISIPASMFGCIQVFDLSLATASHAGYGLEMPPPRSAED